MKDIHREIERQHQKKRDRNRIRRTETKSNEAVQTELDEERQR